MKRISLKEVLPRYYQLSIDEKKIVYAFFATRGTCRRNTEGGKKIGGLLRLAFFV